MKTGYKIAIGLGVVASAFAATKLMKSSKLSPQEKFLKDAYDPTTRAGSEFKSYHEARGEYNAAVMQQSTQYHIDSKSHLFQPYLAKSEWDANEVVN